MDQRKLTVGLGDRTYNIIIGENIVEQAGKILGPIAANRQIVIVTDANVAALHLDRLKTGLKSASASTVHFAVPSGEASKSMTMLANLLDNILALGVDRSVLLIAFGGGVVGDLVGFAAASLLRGVDYVQIPTTLLAQVDSSVGGKTGVNASAGKNLIGAFYQPKAVLADTSFLKTLSPRELRAGYAEVVKYGLLGDAEFFNWLETNSDDIFGLKSEAMTNAIFSSCQIKSKFVEVDERESGKRALLNLGHTFAHALEADAGFNGSLLHGEAVAAGMGLAFDLSVDLGLCALIDATRCKKHLRDNGLPAGLEDLTHKKTETKQIISHMQHDKKVRNGQINFILVRAIGDAIIKGDVPTEMIVSVLQRGRNAI